MFRKLSERFCSYNVNKKENREELLDRECFKYEFMQTMYNIIPVLVGKNGEEIHTIISYIMDIIKNDLKFSLLTKIIYSEQVDVNSFSLLPLFYFDDNNKRQKIKSVGKKEVDFSKDIVISYPWEKDRFVDNILYLSKTLFKYDEQNHKSVFYNIIDVCEINNGFHSITLGVLNKKGKIISDVYDIVPLLNNVYTDGAYWYNKHNSEKIKEVEDFRIAVLFELAKIDLQSTKTELDKYFGDIMRDKWVKEYKPL